LKIRASIENALSAATETLGFADAGVPVILERPREASHGDMSTPLAMGLAKKLKRNPFDIAEEIVEGLSLDDREVASVEVLKPGFINFRFAGSVLRENIGDILDAGERYGSSDVGAGERVQVEYVSANPTGPLVIVSARAAAVGSVLVNLLKFCGFDAEGEYYVNDYGGQVDKLGESLRYRLRERLGDLSPGEEFQGDYPGEYLAEVAAAVEEGTAREWIDPRTPASVLGSFTAQHLLARIRDDLEAFGVTYDSFFLESSLHPDGTAGMFERLSATDYTYERDGAVFFRSTSLGDDKDRVLKKSDGASTYFLSDIAYHFDKLQRKFRRAVGLLGPDHHGHVPRMKAAMSVLGAPEDWLEIMIVGWVRLMEDGKTISMSKRAGEFITMRDLIDDVGSDVAKYFFLMRRANTPLDFDLTLARKHSDENPVYYVQYAHARISSVARFAREKGLTWSRDSVRLDRLSSEPERSLMLHLLYFGHAVEGAALAREPHRLTQYAQELATAFHQFYHECRIVGDDPETSSARLMLAEATMRVLRNALHLLGVSAPSSM
jgi:arginyl-tRNA synthetase